MPIMLIFWIFGCKVLLREVRSIAENPVFTDVNARQFGGRWRSYSDVEQRKCGRCPGKKGLGSRPRSLGEALKVPERSQERVERTFGP